MNAISLIIILIVIILCFLGLFYASSYNKVTELVIKINETESLIDNSLRNKYDSINKIIAIIKGKSEINDQIFDELIKLKSIKISNFELERLLINANNRIIELLGSEKKLETDEEIITNNIIIEEESKKLENYKKYYNDNISVYNKLIKCFPTNIICKINKYKEKTFFDGKDMNDEDKEDFKL